MQKMKNYITLIIAIISINCASAEEQTQFDKAYKLATKLLETKVAGNEPQDYILCGIRNLDLEKSNKWKFFFLKKKNFEKKKKIKPDMHIEVQIEPQYFKVGYDMCINAPDWWEESFETKKEKSK